ncbi:hypothetical protein AMJ49_03020 [Parcubacteria bacterium DG_74_2]|nr:MAG: hypothetical protein AMJ49_03020 [Parcubacteria bacterium DG_74_2]
MIFEAGMKILILFGFFFFFIFWYLCNIWTAPHVGERRNPGAAFMVSFFYTFQFFLIGSIILTLFSFIFESLPDFIQLLKP